MKNSVTHNTESSAKIEPPSQKEPLSKLAQARSLNLPSREAMLNRDPSVSAFWLQNKQLLTEAWHEWEQPDQGGLPTLDDSLLDSKLRDVISDAWHDPAKESAVTKLWSEVSPGVYLAQFFDPEKLCDLRRYLKEAQSSNIPMRPPYGIALNRFGAMLDQRSEGFLAAPRFQSLYNQLLDRYMRPIGRLLFPEIMGYDTQTFGFSIQYEPGVDTSLQLHSDASAVTLNINLNLLDEDFTGSEVDFYDPATGKPNRLSFEPGTAMIHRGSIVHAAQPITSGQRTNMVLWLYGDRMQVPSPRLSLNTLPSPQQRWTIPSDVKDEYAPF